MKKLFRVFKEKSFAPLFFANVFGAFNDNFLKTIVAAFISYRFASHGGDLSYILMILAALAFSLPFFFFSALAGEMADKYNKASYMKAVKAAEVGIVLIIFAAFYFANTYLLFLSLILMGLQSAFFGPVKYSIIPQLVSEKNIVLANSFMEGGNLLSIALSSMMVVFFIVDDHLHLNTAGLFLIVSSCLGLVCTFFIKNTEPGAPDLTVNRNIWKSTVKNLTLTKNSRTILLTILAISWFWILCVVTVAQIPVLSERVLNASPKIFTFILMIFCAGMTVGALMCRSLLKDEVTIKYVPLSSIAMSLFLFVLAIEVWVTSNNTMIHTVTRFLGTGFGARLTLYFFLFGLFGGLYLVPLISFLQTSIGNKIRSRVFATNAIINTFFIFVASIITTVLLTIGFGPTFIFILLAVINAVVALYIATLLPWHIIRAACSFILKFIYDINVKGIENYKKVGKRALIIANHTSFLDAALLAIFLPEDLKFVIDSNVAKKWWVKPFLRLVETFPMDPTNPMAVKSVIDEIKKGQKIVIFPEGRITTTGGIMKIYPGPAMIADKADAEILPISMEGTQYSKFAHYGRKLRSRPSVPITINILEPVRLDISDSLKGKDRRSSAEDKVYDLMADMKFRSYNIHRPLFESIIEARDFAGYNRPAVDDIERKPVSFGKLIMASFLLGDKFTDMAERGEYVGVFLPNSKALAITFFGLHAYGRVPAMINFSTGIKNVVISCQVAKIKTVLTSRMFIEKADLHDMAKAIEDSGVKLVYLEDVKKTVKLWDAVKAWVQSSFPEVSYKKTGAGVKANDPAVVLFTSGSEGVPKGVVLSHTNLQANRRQLCTLVDFGVRDYFLCALPLFHSFGLMGGLIVPLFEGITTFLYPSPLHYRVVPEFVYDRNATVIFGTDTFLAGYAKMAHPYDFYSVRYAVMGAEKLKEETFKIYSEKFGVRIIECYGATEASPGISINTPMHFKRGSAGRFIPGLEHKLKKIEGVDEGEELVIKGPNVMLGYLRADNPGVIEPLKDGWYDTGDIITVDDDGFVQIKGRAKRFAKIAGEMVSLTAVELAISKLWPDNLSAVINVPDAKRGEQIVLYTAKQDATLKEVSDYFKEQGLSDISVPKVLKIVEEVPVMGTGKTNYMKIFDMYNEEKNAIDNPS
ncbi:acyltransferase [Parelusimicrobium proximum]|uniref:acyl-[ACP]--phospholipid O-acyltransferase n=1 Tax=Parelusimicrobium proximum TaxID=3228953 RepID=UPI003D169A73